MEVFPRHREKGASGRAQEGVRCAKLGYLAPLWLPSTPSSASTQAAMSTGVPFCPGDSPHLASEGHSAYWVTLLRGQLRVHSPFWENKKKAGIEKKELPIQECPWEGHWEPCCPPRRLRQCRGERSRGQGWHQKEEGGTGRGRVRCWGWKLLESTK